MTKLLILFFCFVTFSTVWGRESDVVWHTSSRNSSESMPCGGGDIGLNVWVEGNELLFYLSRSGTFDEHNALLKQGRFRLRLSPDPFRGATNFRQQLKLNDGYVEVEAGDVLIQLWVDVYHPVVHVELIGKHSFITELAYENWRYRDRVIRKGEAQQNSYKWAPTQGQVTSRDSIYFSSGLLTFVHRNPLTTVFDVAVNQQGMDSVKAEMMNPLANLTSGGCLRAADLVYVGMQDGMYAGTDFRAWNFRSAKATKSQKLTIALHTDQTKELITWEKGLRQTLSSVSLQKDRKATRQWWNAFWQRSFIRAKGEAEEATHNYTLFRYLLGCNAYGSSPTKFNGGLFTFDPCGVDTAQAFTPDYRKWGGGTMTAQNQRLVYWPMLKSGDFDLMPAQFDFYQRMLRNAELRSLVYWGHAGACFPEQIENFGLSNPSEYGWKRPVYFDKGVEYNAWLEYEWDTVLEFCQMILELHAYSGADVTAYQSLIESSLTFFDEHYRYLALRRGRKALDGDGHLILFPGSACETYKMCNNASSTLAALQVLLQTLGEKKRQLLETIPPIPLRMYEGRTLIAPAKSWERVNNTESPQLYPVFPWRIYGVGREGLEIAQNTYLYDPDVVKFRSHIGWKQDLIFAACLGLTDEARRLMLLKLADGPHRFTAFWGPGFDWTPDHNWGGSGMIGLQEMLLQTVGNRILLFPAWPREWDVHFRLHAPGQTIIEAELNNGKVSVLHVEPAHRRKDIELIIMNR